MRITDKIIKNIQSLLKPHKYTVTFVLDKPFDFKTQWAGDSIDIIADIIIDYKVKEGGPITLYNPHPLVGEVNLFIKPSVSLTRKYNKDYEVISEFTDDKSLSDYLKKLLEDIILREGYGEALTDEGFTFTPKDDDSIKLKSNLRFNIIPSEFNKVFRLFNVEPLNWKDIRETNIRIISN